MGSGSDVSSCSSPKRRMTWANFNSEVSVQNLVWEQLMDFPKHIRDGMLYLVMANRLDLVAKVSGIFYSWSR